MNTFDEENFEKINIQQFSEESKYMTEDNLYLLGKIGNDLYLKKYQALKLATVSAVTCAVFSLVGVGFVIFSNDPILKTIGFATEMLGLVGSHLTKNNIDKLDKEMTIIEKKMDLICDEVDKRKNCKDIFSDIYNKDNNFADKKEIEL